MNSKRPGSESSANKQDEEKTLALDEELLEVIASYQVRRLKKGSYELTRIV